jgi:hypothetical protein
VFERTVVLGLSLLEDNDVRFLMERAGGSLSGFCFAP